MHIPQEDFSIGETIFFLRGVSVFDIKLLLLGILTLFGFLTLVTYRTLEKDSSINLICNMNHGSYPYIVRSTS